MDTSSTTIKEPSKNSPREGWQAEPDGVFSTSKPAPQSGSQYNTAVKFTTYKELPYNPQLKQKARKLRKAGNLSEVLLWNKLKKQQLDGFDFERQKIIGNYIVDFYCAELNLIIEIDGESHDLKGEYDRIRDSYLTNLGLTIIHIPDSQVKHDLDTLITELYQYTQKIQDQLSPPL